MTTSLQKNIMRRIYYAFALKVMTHVMTAQLVALFVVGWWLKELVFVARVWQSFVSTPIGELGTFMHTLITHADYPTIALTLAALVLVGSVVRQLPVLRVSQLKAVT